VVGRKKRSVLDVMKTQLWLAELMRVTRSANLNQLGELIEDSDTKKLLYRYASGQISVSVRKMVDIDAMLGDVKADYISARPLFFVGPRSKSNLLAHAPLWDAIGGSMESVWAVLVSYDPAIAVQKYLGVSYRLRCAYLIYPLFNELDPPPYWESPSDANRIAANYRNGTLSIDIDQITFAIAAWRLAHFMGDSIRMFNYILIGLLDKAIPDVLGSLCTDAEYPVNEISNALFDGLLDMLTALDQKNIDDSKSVIDDLNYHAPIYPVGQEDEENSSEYAQPLDHSFLNAEIWRGSLSAYVADRKQRF